MINNNIEKEIVMISLSINQPYNVKTNKWINFKQSQPANVNNMQNNKELYEKTIINNWTGLSAIIYGLIGLTAPTLIGKNSIKKIIFLNLPLAVVGTFIGTFMGTNIGRRKVAEHNLFIQNITDAQNSAKNRIQ